MKLAPAVVIEKVPAHVAELAAVLHQDKTAERRAAAAFVLAYGTDRRNIVDALAAMQEPNNATRRSRSAADRLAGVVQRREEQEAVREPVAC